MACLLFLGTAVRAWSGTLNRVQTVFLIVMENQDWSDVRGSTNAPYINGVLLPMASHCEQYYNPPGMHPSLTDYLWLEGGTNFGVLDDGSPYTNNCQTPADVQTTTNHLSTYLNNAGISWRGYFEDCPTNVIELAGFNLYVVRHNPFAYFTDVIGTNITTYCTSDSPYGVQHLRPYTDLASDLQANTVGRYNLVIPNLCHDMHNVCAPLTNQLMQGDTWLSTEVPKILNSAAYQRNGLLLLTWDEGATGDGPIGMLVLSPLAKGGGYYNTRYYTHSSTLRTMQEIFGVRPWLGDAANAEDLSDLFQQLEISGVSRQAGGAIQLTITGVIPNSTNIVQASSDLVSWTGVATNSVPTNTFSFSDSVQGAARFYRVVELQ
ncbi:MAG TPA: alkaline phosphatase family protein [Verrucomicrobiae bacterium]|nr:alkaline phosphatase family protein [Verrucomicrobiae bacterium]